MTDRSRPRFSHVGCYTFDPEKMADFYCQTFGLVITDRGVGTTGHNVIFMSGDPHEHHQFVVATDANTAVSHFQTRYPFASRMLRRSRLLRSISKRTLFR